MSSGEALVCFGVQRGGVRFVCSDVVCSAFVFGCCTAYLCRFCSVALMVDVAVDVSSLPLMFSTDLIVVVCSLTREAAKAI